MVGGRPHEISFATKDRGMGVSCRCSVSCLLLWSIVEFSVFSYTCCSLSYSEFWHSMRLKFLCPFQFDACRGVTSGLLASSTPPRVVLLNLSVIPSENKICEYIRSTCAGFGTWPAGMCYSHIGLLDEPSYLGLGLAWVRLIKMLSVYYMSQALTGIKTRMLYQPNHSQAWVAYTIGRWSIFGYM